MVWLYPTLRSHLKINYDESLLTTETIGKEPIKVIMAKAYKCTLTNNQQCALLNEIENNSKIVFHLGKSQLFFKNFTIPVFKNFQFLL